MSRNQISFCEVQIFYPAGTALFSPHALLQKVKERFVCLDNEVVELDVRQNRNNIFYYFFPSKTNWPRCLDCYGVSLVYLWLCLLVCKAQDMVTSAGDVIRSFRSMLAPVLNRTTEPHPAVVLPCTPGHCVECLDCLTLFSFTPHSTDLPGFKVFWGQKLSHNYMSCDLTWSFIVKVGIMMAFMLYGWKTYERRRVWNL